MKTTEQLISEAKPLSAIKEILGFCVYGYVRELDDLNGLAGTIRYIGEGRPSRPTEPHKVRVPTRDYILIYASGLTKEEAQHYEEILIEFYGRIITESGILENKMPRAGWDNTGLVSVKNHLGQTMQVSVANSAYQSGELVHISKNMMQVYDENNCVITVPVDHPKRLSGEYESIQKGFFSVYDENGSVIRTKSDDPKWLSGDYTAVSSGVSIGFGVYKDSEGNIYRLPVDHPDIISKNYVGVAKDINVGMVTVRNPDGSTQTIPTNHPEYVSGKLKHAGTGIKRSDEYRKKVSGEGNPHYDKQLYEWTEISTNKKVIATKNQFRKMLNIGAGCVANHLAGRSKSTHGWQGKILPESE